MYGKQSAEHPLDQHNGRGDAQHRGGPFVECVALLVVILGFAFRLGTFAHHHRVGFLEIPRPAHVGEKVYRRGARVEDVPSAEFAVRWKLRDRK